MIGVERWIVASLHISYQKEMNALEAQSKAIKEDHNCFKEGRRGKRERGRRGGRREMEDGVDCVEDVSKEVLYQQVTDNADYNPYDAGRSLQEEKKPP